MEFIAKKEEDFEKFAEELLNLIYKKKVENPASSAGSTILGLYGNLGSGKTTFTKHLAEQLGISAQDIVSPTFILQKRFEIPSVKKFDSTSSGKQKLFKNLYHIDTYRIENPKEIEKLGWQEIISDPQNLIIVEWANLIEQILPSDTIKLNFEIVDETTRKVNVKIK